MLTLRQIEETIKRYDGRNIWVRTKCLDSSQHMGRAKVIGIIKGKIEIQPEGHKHTELVEPQKLSWWNAEMNKHHPDWTHRSGKFPVGTTFFIVDDGQGQFWHGAANGFRPGMKGAKEFDSFKGVRLSEARIQKKFKVGRHVIKAEAIVLDQKWGDWQPPVVANAEQIKPANTIPVEMNDVFAAWELFVEAGNRLVAALKKQQ